MTASDTTWSSTTRILVIAALLVAGVRLAVVASPLLLSIGLAAITQIEERLFRPVTILGFELNAQDYLTELPR